MLVMVVLMCSNPFMGLMFTAVGPVLPSVMNQFGAAGDGALNAQLIMTIPGVGLILAGPPIGWLTQRYGAALLVRWALLVFALAGAAGMVIDNLAVFLAARFVLGVAASAIATSTLALVGERFEDVRRARILSYQAAAGSAFGFVSLLLSGAMAEAWGWRAPFALYLIAAPVLICALAGLPVRGPMDAAAAAEKSTAERLSSTRGSLKPLWPVFALIVVVFIAVFMNAVQASFLLAADGVTSPSVQSWIMASSAVASSVGAVSYGFIRPRLGARWTFALCLIAMGVGFVTLGLSGGIAIKVLGTVIASLGAGCVGPYVGNLLLDRAAPNVRERAAGLLYSATFVGDFLNPIVVTPLRYAFGIHGAFIVVGGLCAVGALIVLLRRVRSA
ncbi:MAG TPA: MFS transporter [Burkholderiaceae bacterium]|nr:MFS transporter [Burkholderiaceae bacterium]